MTEYTDITNEEYDALDEELSRTVPKLSPNGTGFLSQREMMRSLGFTSLTVNYLLTKATANRKSPAKIIEELIRKEMTTTA